MQSTIHAAHGRGHLSRHERQRLARVAAFSRRTSEGVCGEVAVKLGPDELELIDGLVRCHPTLVSTALLAIAGIASGKSGRQAVLAQVAEAASSAQAEGQITGRRSEQIARHVRRALKRTEVGFAA